MNDGVKDSDEGSGERKWLWVVLTGMTGGVIMGCVLIFDMLKVWEYFVPDSQYRRIPGVIVLSGIFGIPFCVGFICGRTYTRSIWTRVLAAAVGGICFIVVSIVMQFTVGMLLLDHSLDNFNPILAFLLTAIYLTVASIGGMCSLGMDQWKACSEPTFPIWVEPGTDPDSD